MQTVADLGPPIFANWRAFESGAPALVAYEYPLYTDTHIVADLREGFGPYELLNNVTDARAESAEPAITLRVAQHIDYAIYQDHPMDATDEAIYHGGALPDEVAALLSLTHGMRLKAGEIIRRFDDRDPRGYPCSGLNKRPPALLKRSGRGVLPGVTGTRSIASIGPLASFSKLAIPDAVSVLRAARMYQDAIWIAESEPNLAWLLLVSSLESAALAWRTAKGTPAERLEDSRPRLFEKLLEIGGETLVSFVASEIADALGSTSHFLRFTLHFLPEPPKTRPGEWEQHPWSKTAWRSTLGKIYRYRSHALHTGKPFPQPMCDAPYRHETWATWGEKPSFIAARSYGGTWRAEDTPIYLHTFEYVARGVLLKWWASLTA